MKTCCVIRTLAPVLAFCFVGSVLGTPAPVHRPKPKPERIVKVAPEPEAVAIVSLPGDASRSDARVHGVNQRAKEHGISGSGGAPTTAGVSDAKGPAPAPAPPAGEWVPSVSLDYTFIDTDDERKDGADGETHSGAISIDVQGPGGLTLGFNYDYSNIELDAPRYSTEADSHFFTAYVAKSFTPWLVGGVSGGYGNTDTDISSRDGNSTSDTDTWSVSPFLAAVITKGSFFASTSVAYQFAEQDDGDTDSIIAEQTVGYAVTENLGISALARYHNQVDGGSDGDDDWLTVGGRISFQINQNLRAYAGYEYDTLNDTFDNHTLKGGLAVSF